MSSEEGKCASTLIFLSWGVESSEGVKFKVPEQGERVNKWNKWSLNAHNKWYGPMFNKRTNREILPVLRVLSLVLCLTFLSIVLTIVQMTHPGVTCLLVELVLTYPPEEVHLLKCVNKNKNIINNCAWM